MTSDPIITPTSSAAYWISCKRWTCRVVIGPQRQILAAAPIINRFINQPIDNLLCWARRLDRADEVLVRRL